MIALGLFALALAATAADTIAFVALVLQGHATELNPLSSALPVPLAIGIRVGAVTLLGFLAARGLRRRLVRAGLVIAVVVGAVGFGGTLRAVAA